jgi:hypothetical protein
MLSLYSRAWYGAKTQYKYPQPINKADPFIISCGQNARFAIGVIEEHMQQLRKKIADNRHKYERNRRCKITNDILLALEETKHVYIQGEPGLGKTELIDSFLQGKNYWKAGEPSSFLFGTLPDKTDFVWFEDFDLTKYSQNITNLLSLMDGKETSVSRKCVDDKIITLNTKFIFTSNYDIPNQFFMFNRRVTQINVGHRMYRMRTKLHPRQPAWAI